MSLEGLNSLIQLESTRLEGARAVTQNFQSVAATVQQQGMQTASSKNNLAMSRIDSQYTKECAEADVRKIEKRLARERASEALSRNIAGIAMIGNAIGNLGHMFNDINGRQKLGDNPEYLKTPPINPNDSATHVNVNRDPNSGANAVYASGTNSDGSSTVYGYETGKDGVSVGSSPLEANISDYDMERSLGNDYSKLKAENGGKPLSFSELHNKNPQLADKVFHDRAHGISHDGASNLMKVLDVQIPKYTGSTSTLNESQMKSVNDESKKMISGISDVTNPSGKIKDSFDKKDANTIANLQKALDKLPPEIRESITGKPEKKLNDLINANNATENNALKAKLESNSEFVKNLEDKPFPTGTIFYSDKNKDNKDNEDIQVNNNGLAFKIQNISSKDKASIGAKYEKMNFNEIFNEDPNKAKELVGKVVEERFNDLTKDQQDKILKDMGNPNEGFKTKFIAMMESDPEAASKIVDKMGPGTRLQPLDVTQANNNIDAAGANKRLGESKESLKNTLIKDEKLGKGAISKAKDVGKAAVNFLVKTMEESVPYFQAYLKAKERADRTYEELVAAKEKLNAANKKLKAIEMQIDVFSGRGA